MKDGQLQIQETGFPVGIVTKTGAIFANEMPAQRTAKNPFLREADAIIAVQNLKTCNYSWGKDFDLIIVDSRYAGEVARLVGESNVATLEESEKVLAERDERRKKYPSLYPFGPGFILWGEQGPNYRIRG